MAIFVKEGISFTEINLPMLTSIEAQCVQVSRQKGKPVNILNVYNPCNNILLCDLKSLLISPQVSHIICGDFNAHNRLWGGLLSNTSGDVICDFLNDSDLVVLNDDSGTRLDIHTGNTTSIDLTLCSSDISSSALWSVDSSAPCVSM